MVELPTQRFVSFNAKANEIASKLNDLIKSGGVFVVDYKLIEQAYGYVVVVELGE